MDLVSEFAILTLVALLLVVGVVWALRRTKNLESRLARVEKQVGANLPSPITLSELAEQDAAVAEIFTEQGQRIQRTEKILNLIGRWVFGNGGFVALDRPPSPKTALGGPSQGYE